jgi:hypothetical protein
MSLDKTVCRYRKARRALSDKKKIQYCYRCYEYFLQVKNNELLLVFKTNFPKVQILLRITETNQIALDKLCLSWDNPRL